MTELSDNHIKDQNKNLIDTDSLLERAKRLLNK